MTIKFETKFAEKNLDSIIDKIAENLTKKPSDRYLFDCTSVEWFSNEELLVFTSLLSYFVNLNIDFKVLFIKPGTPITDIPERVAKQIIQIWEVWQIGKVLQDKEYFKFFGLDFSAISALKKQFNYYPLTSEIYSRYGITPFIVLRKIDNYNDRAIENILNDVYKLNQATKEIVFKYKCEHPFVNLTLSHIISKELYENFLDHFSPGVFSSTKDSAFMSLSLRTKLNEEKFGRAVVQDILKSNFQSEALAESLSFYYDDHKKEFKNQSLIEFSFIDFGKGITKTLLNAYQRDYPQLKMFEIDESEVLKYAFRHDTSRYSFSERNKNLSRFIPRGLFDVLSIVRRYQGLIVVRSNHGKILYDFSGKKDFDTAIIKFKDEKYVFPGTLLTIYIPAENVLDDFDSSAITPIVSESKYHNSEIGYINLYSIINTLKSEKKNVYDRLIESIRLRLPKDEKAYTLFFSFRGYEYNTTLSKKVLWFLLADYAINLKHNIIIVHPPSNEIVEEIRNELANLNLVVKNYHIHPLPLVYFKANPQSLQLQWLGVYNKNDIKKLNALLFEKFSLSKADFQDPTNIIGHINYFDQFGNLQSFFPGSEKVLNYYSYEYAKSDENEVKRLLSKNDCLFKKSEDKLYLCHGNYYQYEFFEMIHLLNDVRDRNLVSEILYLRMKEKFEFDTQYTFIGITSSSHKILSAMVDQKLIDEKDVIYLDNYFSFNSDDKLNKINKGQKCILVCDIIATGYLAVRMAAKMNQKEAQLSFIAVILSTIDTSFETSKDFVHNFRDQLVILHHYPIPKYRLSDNTVSTYLKKSDPIRVNPFTNVTISLTIEETIYNTIILKSKEFLDEINEEDIKIGYLKFNNMVHPYFFDTKGIIADTNHRFLKKIFGKINIPPQGLNVFYPKDSGIRYLDFDFVNNEIFKDHSVEYFELERFNTSEGWKFPHSTDYFLKLNDNKTVLILDDGSCTGDSLIQMIDEMAFSNVKKIVVLCIIGRITDHKREFLSRLSSIKVKGDVIANVSVYFATHWHIPTYYLEENPNTKEKAWLEKIIALQNTPEAIKAIASTVLKAITPQILGDFEDYKYVPRKKDNANDIPKKV